MLLGPVTAKSQGFLLGRKVAGPQDFIYIHVI